MTLIANGHREPMTKSMALDLAAIYEATGRTIHRSRFVNTEAASNNQIFDGISKALGM